MADSDFILYTTEDGRAEIELRAEGGTVWLTQARMAELFATTPQAITQLLRTIYEDAELVEEATCKELLQVRTEGARQVTRSLRHYSLDAILAVGYRVRSPRGVQFRRWANGVLREYLVKGFAMNDARMKAPDWDYFDELLERIRDIRTSEARFYQKVRDILSLSEDYDARAAATFFATIQNRMLYAVTSMTAGELIRDRGDASAPNMGLTTWKGAGAGRPVRKGDVGTAKNYLAEAEVSELNLIVETFLNTAELRAKRRRTMRLADWESVLDGFLQGNDLPRLQGAGGITAAEAKRLAHDRYAAFDTARKQAATVREGGDLEELARIAAAAAASPGEGDG